MPPVTTNRLLRLPVFFVLLFLVSCRNEVADIPFPVSDSMKAPLTTVPLKFSDPTKVSFVAKMTTVVPVIKKLDLDALPSTPYDVSGFRSFSKPPVVAHFDFSKLPDTAVDINKMPDILLAFTVMVLPPPVLIKAGMLIPKIGPTISVSDMWNAQGLAVKNVYAVYEDRKGFIWLSTDKGLYRYDGEYFQLYASLPGGWVVNILEDRKGRIWFLNGSGIGYIDPAGGILAFSTKIATRTPALPKMILDSRGDIWLTRILDRAAVIINPEKGTFKNLTSGIGLSNRSSWGVCEDRQKNIWLTSSRGTDIINAGRTSIRHLKKDFGVDSARAITMDSAGRIWIAVSRGGVSCVDLPGGTITTYGEAGGPDLKIDVSYRLSFDDKGQLWIAANNGVFVINPRENQFRTFNDKEGLVSDFILDVMPDRLNRIWLASFSGGARVIDQFGAMVHPAGTKVMSALMEDSKGKIWVGAGSSNDGIQILDKENKKISVLKKENGLADNFIQSLLEEQGKIWISSDGGFDIISPAAKTLEHIGKKEGLTSDTIYGISRDRAGNVWFTGPALGVDRLDSAGKRIYHAGINEGLSENSLGDVREDLDGNIWIAYYTKGVSRINLKQGTIENLTQAPGLRDTCNKLLLLDDVGRMWIGTDKGIYIADTKKNILTTLTTAEGLSDNSITSMIPYHGKVIVGMEHKVNIVTPLPYDAVPTDTGSAGRWRVAVLAGSEGLSNANNNWNTNAITKKDEYLWGDAGVTVINGIREASGSMPVHIVGISVLNQPMKFNNRLSLPEKDTIWYAGKYYTHGETPPAAGFSQSEGLVWDSVGGSYGMPANLHLAHDQNYLQFQFAQQHEGSTAGATYSYILEGLDKHWSAFTSKTSTDNYLNLAPGDYTFKVRSLERNDHWGKPASFSFTITPPWWKSWWMYLVYILALAGAIFGYNKYRSTALQKENSLLEEKVNTRTREVKQQADELMTINQISQALVSQADLQQLIQLVGNQLKDLFKANIVYVALLDKKTKIISFPYQYGDNMAPLTLGEGLTSKIILSGKPMLINKDVHEKTTDLGLNRVGLPAASYLGVPIPVADEIIGVLSIQSTEKENRFAEKDSNLLTTIAANVGVAIRKARLFEEVKSANKEADAARKTAEEANAAKSAFLSTVSHELRTPLTSVLGFTRITKKGLEEKIFPLTDRSDPKTVKTINQISANLNVVIAEGERLTNLINDVLDLAKIEAGKMEWNMAPVYIPDILDRAVLATSALFQQKNLQLSTEIADSLPDVSGDQDKLIQVVVNLLSNAVKFTEQGAVTCRVFQKDGAVVVGITDTGIGIAPQDHDKVFEQFKQVGDTLTDKPKGTGLGLPICKEIVEHHQGKIWLDSELGKGSTFYFMLPVIAAEEKKPGLLHFNDLLGQLKRRVEQSHPAIQRNEDATILVVDDDDGIRSLLKQELGEAGYHVEEAANGKEAIAKIRKRRPDLVILDVMMPEMNGFDVAAILKNDPQTMEIPIIILSIVQDKSRGFRIGVDRYLTKPIDTGLLFSEIGHLLEQGKSRKKVLVVDEDSVTVRTLTDVLEAKGYQVVESDGKEVIEKAIATQPDIIILNSVISDKQEIVKLLRFEKGLENVLFLIYQ